MWRGGEGEWKYDRVTVGVREYLGRKIETTGIGVLALRIATILVAQIGPRDNKDLLRGVNANPDDDGLRRGKAAGP